MPWRQAPPPASPHQARPSLPPAEPWPPPSPPGRGQSQSACPSRPASSQSPKSAPQAQASHHRSRRPAAHSNTPELPLKEPAHVADSSSCPALSATPEGQNRFLLPTAYSLLFVFSANAIRSSSVSSTAPLAFFISASNSSAFTTSSSVCDPNTFTSPVTFASSRSFCGISTRPCASISAICP